MRSRMPGRRALAAASACGLATALLVAWPTAAQAAPVADVAVVPIATSSSQNLGGFSIIGVEPVTLTVFDLDVTAHATWTGSLTSTVGYESDDVRQGATLDVSRSASPTTGAISTAWQLTGSLIPLGIEAFAIDIGTINLSKDNVTCLPQLSGAAYDCSATSDSVTLVKTPGVPLSPYVNMAMTVTFTITPEGVVTDRTFSIGGDALTGPDSLTTTDSPAVEQLDVPCTATPGETARYEQVSASWTPATTASQRPAFVIGLMDPVLGVAELPALFEAPFGPPIVTNPAFALTGTGHTADMGGLLPNDVKPTIGAFAGFSGDEGEAIAFSASTTSQCPIESHVWSFSDGTTSYGESPQRSFADDGVHSGQLTVTDITGLSATRAFSVTVANALPTAQAGPDTSGAWGRPIAFTGQGVDPGSGDQATLTYSWDWGDGTPGTGGASASHTYATPGVRVATLTVCDDHGCATDTTTVTVNARATTTSYTGTNVGQFSAPVQLQASVVDEFGDPVAGVPVAFSLGGSVVGSSSTGFGGSASRTVDVTLPAGTTDVAVAFAGTAKYLASGSAEAFDVTRMTSSLTYTGAVKGGPNKTVTLSAKLVDGLGRPLGGKPVEFTLGTQSAGPVLTHATTGVATTTLKLAQKNGKYVVTATWTPTGTDADRWTGSSTSVAFSLQAK